VIKSQLTLRIEGQSPHLYLRHVEKGVRWRNATAWELRGFGVFSVKVWPPRRGRNPKTGATVSVPETIHAAFKAGKLGLTVLATALLWIALPHVIDRSDR
jgi:integration host factor subunit beta